MNYLSEELGSLESAIDHDLTNVSGILSELNSLVSSLHLAQNDASLSDQLHGRF